ncbi:uncharacterized protein LOC125956827 [Anopheles darlingi]|uniref:uncharacterized protein LOC125956827 n=1 Tax=Anopheles darlingi TaxID=43151 RepID=UPI00210045A5|nr:uncharacterized protein LOC125956827 [Anopheles darlingi]
MSTKKRTLPRRTQEFDVSVPQSSVKKPPNRVSRIAQPIRKSAKPGGLFGENRRSRSMDRGLNLIVPGVSVPTTASKKSLNPRSSSATPQLRTPLRSVGLYANSGNAETVPSTVERERFTAEGHKVFEYLAQSEIPELAKEFIERGSLRSMSMKQFLIIVAHLLRQIGGSRYKIGSNFIEDIMRAITELQCPFTVNKSMLKTPSAPHSLGQITLMLTWLIQLAPKPPGANETEWAPTYLQAEEFPTADFTRFFFQSAIDSFHLWNLKREEEFGAKVDAMVDQLVACRTDGLTTSQVLQRTEQIKQQLDAFGTEQVAVHTRDHSFDGVQREVAERQREQQRLAEEVKQLTKELGKCEQQYHRRQKEYFECENAIRRLEQELASQQLTVEERDEIYRSMALTKNLITAKQNAVMRLQETSSDLQIQLSHLIKHKINGLSELNTQLHNWANALRPDIQFQPFDINHLLESQPAELAQALTMVERQLSAVFQQCRDLYRKLSEEKSLLESKLADAQLILHPLDARVTELKKRLEKLQKERDQITQALGGLASRSNAAEAKREQEQELLRAIENTRDEVERNKKAIVKLGHDKQQVMRDCLERCRVAQEKKERKLAALREYVESGEAIMEKIVDSLGVDSVPQ